MNASFKSHHHATTPSYAHVAGYQGSTVRQSGGMSAAFLDNQSFGADRVVGMTKAIQESVDAAFGVNEFESDQS